MATTLRVASFNLENLFNRYALLDTPWEGRNYEKLVQAIDIASVASREGDLVSYETTGIQRNNTAQAIFDAAPDVLAVMEVENLHTLRIFNDEYLANAFDRILLVDGNDPRGIDVGFMIRKGCKAEIQAIRTHVDETSEPGKSVHWGTRRNFGYLAQAALFSRDCLEVDVKVGAATLTFLVNHLKAQDGQAASDKRRLAQSQRVAALAAAAKKAGKLPVVLGDLNADVASRKKSVRESLAPLFAGPLVDAFAKVPDHWTHFYESDGTVSRLDYILVDPALQPTDHAVIRAGLSRKCKQYTGTRYPTVSYAHTEASDHCPIAITVKV